MTDTGKTGGKQMSIRELSLLLSETVTVPGMGSIPRLPAHGCRGGPATGWARVQPRDPPLTPRGTRTRGQRPAPPPGGVVS